MDIVVSAITKNYTKPRSVVKYNPKWQYYMFTDNKDLEVPFPWKKQYLPDLDDRMPKLQAHRLMTGWDTMIWVDGSVLLTEDPDLIKAMLGSKNEMLVRRHTRVNNPLEDIDRCIQVGKIPADLGIKLFAKYVMQGGFDYNSYAELGCFVRRNSDRANAMFDRWADRFQEDGVRRDQPAFAITADKEVVKVIDPYKVKICQVGWHTQKTLKHIEMTDKITYVTNLSSSKKLTCLDNVDIPDNEWLCLTDADSMFLESSDGEYLSQVVKQHPETHIFGCMTNRQGLHYQVEEPHQFENNDMTYHARTAQYMRAQYRTYAPIINVPVAGQFMLMPGWLLKEFPLMETISGDSTYFDWDLCQRVLEAGGRIRLIKGLYRYHLYRNLKGHHNATHLS